MDNRFWLTERTEHDTLIFTQDVAELKTGHIIFVTLYVNAGTWSLMKAENLNVAANLFLLAPQWFII